MDGDEKKGKCRITRYYTFFPENLSIKHRTNFSLKAILYLHKHKFLVSFENLIIYKKVGK